MRFRDSISRIHRLATSVILITNILYFGLLFNIIIDKGGPMGMGLIVIPIVIITLLFSIPAIIVFKSKTWQSNYLLIVNCIGFFWNLGWIIFSIIPIS